jgi:hypothetical protein
MSRSVGSGKPFGDSWNISALNVASKDKRTLGKIRANHDSDVYLKRVSTV